MTYEERITALEALIHESLPDRGAALSALTHRSYAHERSTAGEAPPHNERLEFLGDAVLDLAVSERLMERCPELREGELSRRRATIVNESTLAAVARGLRLGELLLLGRGEELTGGREKPSVLADALEAVVAVIYLRGGMPQVLAFVDRFFAEAFAVAGTSRKDHKTRLQELLQAGHQGQPRYRVLKQSGADHALRFEVEVSLQGQPLGTGSGASKKEAEQEAAQAALRELEAMGE